jgi:hypothetical protein
VIRCSWTPNQGGARERGSENRYTLHWLRALLPGTTVFLSWWRNSLSAPQMEIRSLSLRISRGRRFEYLGLFADRFWVRCHVGAEAAAE